MSFFDSLLEACDPEMAAVLVTLLLIHRERDAQFTGEQFDVSLNEVSARVPSLTRATVNECISRLANLTITHRDANSDITAVVLSSVKPIYDDNDLPESYEIYWGTAVTRHCRAHPDVLA